MVDELPEFALHFVQVADWWLSGPASLEWCRGRTVQAWT